MRRYLWISSKWAVRIFVFVLLTATIFAVWLFGSNTGAKWTLNLARPYIPVNIHYEQMNGNLWRGLATKNLMVTAKGSKLGFKSIRAKEFSFAWHPVTLLGKQLFISRLHAEGTDITLGSPSKSDNSTVTLPNFRSPISLTVRELDFANGRLSNEESTYSELPDIRLGLHLSEDSLQINNLNIRYQQENYKGSARFIFSNPFTYYVQENGHGEIILDGSCEQDEALICTAKLNWKDFSHPLAKEPELPHGQYSLTYTDSQLSLEGSSTLRLKSITTETSSKLNINFAERALLIDTFEAPLYKGNLSITGDIHWKDKVDIKMRAIADDISLAAWLPERLEQSKISFESKVQAQADNGDFTANTATSINNLTLGKHPLSGDLKAKYEQSRVRLERLSLSNESANIELSGYYDLAEKNIQSHLQFAINKLENIFPRAEGDISSKISLEGYLFSPLIDISLASKAFNSGLVNSQNFNLSLNLITSNPENERPSLQQTLDAIQIKHLKINADLLSKGTTALEHTSLALTGNLNHHQLELSSKSLPGNIELNSLTLAGALEIPLENERPQWLSSQWRGEITDFKLSQNDLPEIQFSLKSPAPLMLSQSAMQLDALCLEHTPNFLCLEQLSLQELRHFSLTANLGGARLENKDSIFGGLHEKLPQDWTIEGKLEAKLSAHGEFNPDLRKLERLELNSKAALHELAFHYRDEESEIIEDYYFDELWVEIKGDEQTLIPGGKLVFNGKSTLTLNGYIEQWLQPQRDTNIHLQGELDKLKYFQAFFPSVTNLDGKLTTDIQYLRNGKQANALILGHLVLDDFSLFIPAYGTDVKQWNLKLNATKDKIALEGDGKIGEGSANVRGIVEASTEQQSSSDRATVSAQAAIKGDRLALINLPDARLTASPDLRLQGEGLNWHLAGLLEVSDSHLILQELPASAVRVSEDARIYGSSEERQSLFTLTSDVQLIAEDNIHFQGFGLDTGIKGRLRFTQDGKRVKQLQGSLNLPEGEFKAYGQTLEIENGQITFSGPTNNPGLDVRAARRIDTVTAGIWLHGTARKPESSLYSTPSMSESDILSYLISGRPMSENTGSESGHMESAALALGLRQALPALQKIGSQFGLSDISVDAGPAGGGGSIAAGKRLNDKLFVKYQYGLVGAVGRFVIEYELSKRLKLEAGSGETDTIDISYTWDSPTPESVEEEDGPE